MYVPSQSLPLYLQSSVLLRTFNQFKRIKYVREKSILFEGFLQPSPLSKVYRVRIEYKFRHRPSVTLPDENFSTQRPPHTFKDGELCLYHREGTGAWDSKMPITGIIPMISHWLWCYEVWQATGKEKWYGEEYPHEPEEEKKSI